MGAELGQGGLAQVIAVGIVAGVLDLVVATLAAQVFERLAGVAQSIVHVSGAIASLVPVALEPGAARFEARLFGAEGLQLLLELSGLGIHCRALRLQGGELLAESGLPPLDLLLLLAEAGGKGFRAGQAFEKRGVFGAEAAGLFLVRLELLAERRKLFGRADASGFGSGPRFKSRSVALLRGGGALPRGLHFRVAALKVLLTDAQIHAETREFRVGLFAVMRGKEHRLFSLTVQPGGFFERLLVRAELRGDAFEGGVGLFDPPLELDDFRI